MKKNLLIMTFMFFTSMVVNAQNFSGNYAIQSKEMVEGIEYLNAIAQEISITQTKDSIIIVRVTPASEGTTTSREALPLNGRSVITTTSSKRKKTASIQMNPQNNTAILKTLFSYADKPDEVEFTNTEVWTIQSDGSITIMKTSDAAVTDDWIIKASFVKSK